MTYFFVVFALKLNALSASPEVPTAVIPPPPSAGSIKCVLRDEDGKITNLAAEILPVEDKQLPQVQFSSQENKILGGKYQANWEGPMASFVKSSEDWSTSVFLTFVTPTYFSQHSAGSGAMAARIVVRGERYTETYKYYAGFCQFTNPKPFRLFE